MEYYFSEEEVSLSKKKKNILLGVYYATLFVYFFILAGLFLWYKTLPYLSDEITKVKVISILLTVVFVIYSFVYLYIPYGRTRAYYNLVRDMKNNLKETYTGRFLGVNTAVQDKGKIDMISLRFSIFNKYKNENFERKVLIFADREVPDIKIDDIIDFTTQSNVLICYEKHKEK